MGYEEKYCIWSMNLIRRNPLEEASEHERIPSIIGSIVWCFPTSRVFYNKVVVVYIVSYIVCGDYIHISLVLLWYFVFRYLVLNNWYLITFLGWKCGKIFLFFADLFFRKKRGS
jgi:hypothetical protein